MKLISFIFILFCSPNLFAAFETNGPSRTELLLGINYLNWNESMRLQQGVNISSDAANFTGMNFNVEKTVIYTDWGWSLGANLGTGKATGGGNSTIAFQKSNQAWTSYGAYVKGFERLTTRVSMGLVAPLFIRRIQWTSDDPSISATSGQNINMGLLFEINSRIAKDVDFYQDIGSLTSGSTTIWRIGVNYQIR